jgi:hypothetical protein
MEMAMEIKMKKATRALLSALLLVAPAMAAAQEPAPAGESEENGVETRSWIDLQVSNSAALAEPRPMPGEIADQVFARYAKSFSHPIPETFNRDKFVEGGGSSQ